MRLKTLILTGAALVVSTISAHATLLQQFNINDLVDRSDSVFRGTVIDVHQSSVAAGGGQIPAIVYRLRVEDMLKGTADISKGDTDYMEIRMVGSLKEKAREDGLIHFSMFRDVPKLSMGNDYVLFMTPESSVGLSVTVGLGQGAFNIVPTDKEDMAVNQYSNQGLGLGSDGPVSYSDLKTAIAANK